MSLHADKHFPSSNPIRDFFRSPAFSHGLIIVDSLDAAIEQVGYVRDFYFKSLFCGSLRQLTPSPVDHRRHPYSVCLRAHGIGEVHGWDRDHDGHLAGQSSQGWKMVREFMAVMGDRDEALTCLAELNLTPLAPDWKSFEW